jgi:hypothetical protein
MQLIETLLIASIPKNWKQYNTDRAMSASYHDIHLEINSADGRIETKHHVLIMNEEEGKNGICLRQTEHIRNNL